MNNSSKTSTELNLDPPDWEQLRQLGHQMVDDMVDYLAGVRQRPVVRASASSRAVSGVVRQAAWASTGRALARVRTA